MTTISHIKISNILGIAELDFAAGRFVQISGPNGSGKTSILEAIKATLRSGHDATLLRSGTTSGEAVIVLDDGMEITKRINESGSDTVVKDATGRRVAKPGTVVAGLADLFSVNPVDFLRAGKKERVAVLLESLPIELDYTRLPSLPSVDAPILPPGVHALVALDATRKAIFDARTGTNRAVKEKHATINQLAATLPDKATDVPGGADGLLGQLSELNKAKDAELERIHTKLEGLRTTMEQECEALRRQIQAKQDGFNEITAKATTQRQLTVEKYAADSAGIRSNLAAIQEAQKSAAKHESTRQTINTMRNEAEGLQEEADTQTAAIESIDTYKSELLSTLPIPGLTVVEGEIYRDGVQFDRLNQAQQVQIAVEVAKLRAGKLAAICVDGLECLDSATMDEFQNQALASGLQLFVSRVSDDDFNISSREQ